jgi:hypothetical protein
MNSFSFLFLLGSSALLWFLADAKPPKLVVADSMNPRPSFPKFHFQELD